MTSTEVPATTGIIKGTGEMADRIRSFPWHDNILGPIESWPPELVSMVNMVLSTDEMAAVYWGPEMILLYNDTYLPHLTDKHPALGKPFWVVWEEARRQVEELMESPYKTGKTFVTPPVPLELVRNGQLEQTYYSMTGSPIFVSEDGATRVGGVYLTLKDETANVFRMQELAKNSAREGRILASIGDGVIVTDADDRITSMNGVAQQLTGWSEAESQGRPLESILKLINEHTREKVVSPTSESKATGNVEELANHTLLIGKTGKESYIDDSAAPIRDNDGQVTGSVLVFRDVEERRIAEQQRDLLLTQLRDIQNATTDSIVTINRDWIVTYMNAPARLAAGPLADAIGKNFWDQYPGMVYDGSPYLEHYHRAMDQRIAGEFEAYYPAPVDGWFDIRARPTPEGIVIFFRDVTLKKKEEALLKSTAERLQLTQMAGQVANLDWDMATGGIIWAESRWAWGRPAEELDTVDKCFRLVHPDDLSALQDVLSPVVERPMDYSFEFRTLWPDGSYHWVLGRGRSILPDATGKPTRVLGVNVDMTERKLSEAALLQNEKLAAVGRLASSIAHEINNPLESVTNLIYLARSGADVSQETQSYLETADHELRRVSQIASQTLRFHKQSTHPTRITREKLLCETISIYQGRTANAHIRVEERHRSDQVIACFEGEIRQVLSNLVPNAIDAMPLGGRLLVRSRAASSPSSGVKGIVLTVADTGTGMSPATQSKVFEAFYSTKGINGTGLGLWISKEIVDRHRGTLRARSSQQPGHSGTVFTLFLPIDAATR